MKRIELGQQEPKEFMDEMMESVIFDLDLNKPLDIENPNFLLNSYYSFIQNTLGKSSVNNMLSCITGIFIILNMVFVMNYAFGIGNCNLHFRMIK